jgi:hypothetical protein
MQICHIHVQHIYVPVDAWICVPCILHVAQSTSSHVTPLNDSIDTKLRKEDVGQMEKAEDVMDEAIAGLENFQLKSNTLNERFGPPHSP